MIDARWMVGGGGMEWWVWARVSFGPETLILRVLKEVMEAFSTAGGDGRAAALIDYCTVLLLLLLHCYTYRATAYDLFVLFVSNPNTPLDFQEERLWELLC